MRFSILLALLVNTIALWQRHVLRKKVQESYKAFGLYKGFSLAAIPLALYHTLNIFILFLSPEHGLCFMLRLAELVIVFICSLIWMIVGGWSFFHASFLLLMMTVNVIPLWKCWQ